MRRLSGNDIVLKVLGLLSAAAVLKGHELLRVPVAGKALWSWRPFLIFSGGVRACPGCLVAIRAVLKGHKFGRPNVLLVLFDDYGIRC